MLQRKLKSRRNDLTHVEAEALKAKICKTNEENLDKTENIGQNNNIKNIMVNSSLFALPLWKRFYELECKLNDVLRSCKSPAKITHIYNPVEYASEVHCEYLRRFLGSDSKRLVIVGMNPGPNGMGQTGVPFGNIITVRDYMGLNGKILQPTKVHGKRPVNGFNCKIEEPSGVRIWNVLKNLAGGDLMTFAKQCFVHNFCPLAFFDVNGKNITPSELQDKYKMEIRDNCLLTFEQEIALIKPDIIIPVGDYVYQTIKKSKELNAYKIIKLPHPSPRALNNQNWPEKAEKFFKEHELIKYLRNENNNTPSVEEAVKVD